MTERWKDLLLLLAAAACLAACGGGGKEEDAEIDEHDPDPVFDDAADGPDDTDAEWLDVDCGSSRVTARCGELDLILTAWDGGLLGIRYVAPDDPLEPRSWAVEAEPPVDASFSITPSDGSVDIVTAHFSVTLSPSSCSLRVSDSSGTVILEDPAAGAWSEGIEEVDGIPTVTKTVTRLTPGDEHFYGFGEKTGGLDRRGRRLVFWNTDPYDSALGGYAPDADPLYQSIPFFIGLRGAAAYGLLTDNAFRMEMDMAASDPGAYSVKIFGGVMDQVLVAGPSMADVVSRYTGLTGRMPLPPLWSLGYHQSRWGYSPDTRLEEIGDQFRTRGIPADGLWLDIQHMDGFRTFTWDPAAFPDPEGMIARLEAGGFKVTVIADPGIKVDDAWDVYLEGLAGNHYLQTPEGEPYVGEVWPGPAVFPDFTDPDARLWWGFNVQDLVRAGVRGLWLDVNEPTNFPEASGGTVPVTVIAGGDGVPTTMAEAHNVYALQEARATYEAMVAAAPDRRPFILSRAGFAGIQRYAAVWTGDAPSTWDSLGQTLAMLLGMGLSGIAFAGSDVGGYSGYATTELFARWMAVGSISPFFRGHVTSGVNNQEPWEFGPEVEDISRSLITERYRLLPYLYSLFAEAARTGAPVLRPMVYVFQDDPSLRDVGDQAMLGPFILYAPVVEEGATGRTVILPEGRWFEAHSGAVHEGPATMDIETTLAALPVYIREGAVVPSAQPGMWTGEADVNPLFLDIYPSPRPTTFTLYEDAGDGFGYEGSQHSRITYTLRQTESGAGLAASPRDGAYEPAPRTLVVRLHRADHGAASVMLDHIPLPSHDSYEALMTSGPGWWYDAADLAIVAVLSDRDDFDLTFEYDTSLVSPDPPVAVAFEVSLPPGTPTDTPIHIATSVSGWTHLPLEWGPGPDMAHGLVPLPRGEWFFYKYTRGDWSTVEKWSGCVEASNRYGFAAAHPVRRDAVALWADGCP
jgi:alpha-glucosidase